MQQSGVVRLTHLLMHARAMICKLCCLISTLDCPGASIVAVAQNTSCDYAAAVAFGMTDPQTSLLPILVGSAAYALTSARSSPAVHQGPTRYAADGIAVL
jgi:hypothetical protein